MHELRNPLNTISMNAELAKMLVLSQNEEVKIEELLDRIIEQCEVCSTLIETMDN
jgi:signal transduction histidine kinase